MAKRGIQPSGMRTRQKMMAAAVTLFLQKGYQDTATAAISTLAGMAPSAFFRAFPSKESVLLGLVENMFTSQFEMAECEDPLMVYAVETAMQLNIAEQNEALRDLYVTAYSLPNTSEYIYQNTARKLYQLFHNYLPEASESDFYELEIATAGITRGYMARKCDIYFTIETKIRRHLQCCMGIFHVPEEKITKSIEAVLAMDMDSMAKKAVADAVAKFSHSEVTE